MEWVTPTGQIIPPGHPIPPGSVPKSRWNPNKDKPKVPRPRKAPSPKGKGKGQAPAEPQEIYTRGTHLDDDKVGSDRKFTSAEVNHALSWLDSEQNDPRMLDLLRSVASGERQDDTVQERIDAIDSVMVPTPASTEGKRRVAYARMDLASVLGWDFEDTDDLSGVDWDNPSFQVIHRVPEEPDGKKQGPGDIVAQIEWGEGVPMLRMDQDRIVLGRKQRYRITSDSGRDENGERRITIQVTTDNSPEKDESRDLATDLDRFRERVAEKYPDVKLDVHESSSGHIVVSRIVVPKSKRDKGTGTAIMDDLTELADEYGKPMALSPSTDFGGNKEGLKRFYKRHGFVANSGPNKDYTTQEAMVRMPKDRGDKMPSRPGTFQERTPEERKPSVLDVESDDVELHAMQLPTSHADREKAWDNPSSGTAQDRWDREQELMQLARDGIDRIEDDDSDPLSLALQYWDHDGQVHGDGLLDDGKLGKPVDRSAGYIPPDEDRVHRAMGIIDQAMEEHVTTEPVVVYLGIDQDEAKRLLGHIGGKYNAGTAEIGSTFTDARYLTGSVSQRSEDIKMHGSMTGVKLEIRVPEGIPALRFGRPDEDYELYDGENPQYAQAGDKVMLDRELTYRIVSDEMVPYLWLSHEGMPMQSSEDSDGVRRVVLEVVPPQQPMSSRFEGPDGTDEGFDGWLAGVAKGVRDKKVAPKASDAFESDYAQRFEDAFTGPDAMDFVPVRLSDPEPNSLDFQIDGGLPGASRKRQKAMASSVKAYTGTHYKPINGGLRLGEPLDDENLEHIRNIDDAQRQSIVQEDIVVWRGVDGSKVFDMDPEDFPDDFTGLEFQDDGFVSTTLDKDDPDVLSGFSGNEDTPVVFQILVPKGSHAIGVPGYESEVLLPRGYRYKVVADDGVRDDVIEGKPVRVLKLVPVPKEPVPTAMELIDLHMDTQEGQTFAERENAMDELKSTVDKIVAGDYKDGITVRTETIESSQVGLSLTFRIYDKDGKSIGHVERNYQYDRDNDEVTAVHVSLDIDEEAQGNGVATELNSRLFAWYRDQGIKTVETSANIDVGGYAWPSQGFDFASEEEAEKYLTRALDKLDEGIKARAAGKDGISFDWDRDQSPLPAPFILDDGRIVTEQELLDLRQMLEEMQDESRPASAIEIARFGAAGKWLMLGGHLAARLYL